MNAGRLAAVDGRRCWVKAGQRIQHRHHVLGLAAPAHPDGQTEAAMFIDHVEELERPPISAGFGLKVHGPGLVREFGLVAPYRAIGRTSPLVVHQPAFPTQQAVGHARWPQRMGKTAIAWRRRRSFPPSIKTTLPRWRWVLRCCPTPREPFPCDAR
jgi:hypothetical protein